MIDADPATETTAVPEATLSPTEIESMNGSRGRPGQGWLKSFSVLGLVGEAPHRTSCGYAAHVEAGLPHLGQSQQPNSLDILVDIVPLLAGFAFRDNLFTVFAKTTRVILYHSSPTLEFHSNCIQIFSAIA